jgi:hypothetical protein
MRRSGFWASILILGTIGLTQARGEIRVVTAFDDNYSQGWKKTLDSSDSGNPNNVSFSQVQGIGTPPLGSGSVKLGIGMTTVPNGDAAMVRTNTLNGVKISDLRTLNFSAYQTHVGVPAFVYFWVDFTNDGTNDDMLFYNTSYNGRVENQWQTFNALSDNAEWYLFFANGESVRDYWANYVAAYPDAVIYGAINFTIGFWSGYQADVYFDNVSLATASSPDVITYNFEIPVVEQVVTTFDDNYTQGWKKTLDSSDSGNPNNVSFSQVQGIGTPPLGSGSVKLGIGMTTVPNGDAAMVRTNTLSGVKISDLRTLDFSAYQTHVGVPAFVYFWVDFTNDGTNDDMLFYNTSYNGRVENQWQTFNALNSNAEWYLFFANGESVRDYWANYVAAYPDAVIYGAINFTIGFWSGYQADVYFDNIRLATATSQYVTAYNFEMPVVTHYPGDANGDNMVDVGDLGILAANYGGSGKSWAEGDFNGDKLVDVGDLGILAANYGYGTTPSSANFDADYAKVFGAAEFVEETDDASSVCSGLGLPLIAGLALMALMAVKLEE